AHSNRLRHSRLRFGAACVRVRHLSNPLRSDTGAPRQFFRGRFQWRRTMGHMLARSFDRFSDADNARSALLDSGIPPSCVQLDANMDEAAATGGSWMFDTKEKARASGKTPGTEKRQGTSRADPEWCSTFVLTVDASDDNQRSLALGILERY